MADDTGRLNDVLAETSFLFGGNAEWVEAMQARWAADPASVEPSWAAFFTTLSDSAETVRRQAESAIVGARRDRRTPPRLAGGHRRCLARGLRQAGKPDRRVGADGETGRGPRPARSTPLRAIMMIRAYRMRGHLKAKLDPLGVAITEGDATELDPATYGFAESDYDRPIFLDYVLGLGKRTVREILELLRRTYCGTVGVVQYMHITNPSEKPGCSAGSRGATRRSASPKEGKIAILKKLIEAEGFEQFLAKRYPGAKRFGLDGAESAGPGPGTNHQARRRSGGEGHRRRHAAPGAPQRARRGDGQALPRDLPRVPGRFVPCPRTSRVRAM